jgi:curved DNA-binding protein
VQTDYYEILGVTRSASPEEIKAAYRRLARRYHPDASDDPGAEDRFKEITLAYQVLRDMDKRVRYDLDAMERELEATERELRADETEAGAAANTTVHLGDTLPPQPAADTVPPPWEPDPRDEPHEPPPPDRRAGLFQRFGRRRAERAETGGERVRGNDHEAIAQIALEEAIRGATVAVAVPIAERGTNGGSEPSARTVEVRVPKFTVDGQRLRVKGQGGPGANGGPPGDLYAIVTYKRHHLFRLLGADVWFYLPIAPWEAVLGAVVDVPTLEKPFRIHVPAGATSGKTFRLPGRGLPKPDGGRSDLLACLRIITPEFPTESEKQLYLQLARGSRFNPRRGFG